VARLYALASSTVHRWVVDCVAPKRPERPLVALAPPDRSYAALVRQQVVNLSMAGFGGSLRFARALAPEVLSYNETGERGMGSIEPGLGVRAGSSAPSAEGATHRSESAMTEEPPFPEVEETAGGLADRVAPSRSAEGRGPLIVLAYLWLFCLVPLFVEKEDPEVGWHARHGLVLTIAELVALLVYGFGFLMVGVVAPSTIPHLLLIGPWAGLLVFWAHVVLAWEALHGRRLRVPGVSHWADRPVAARA
jgi:hypothetical protein